MSTAATECVDPREITRFKRHETNRVTARPHVKTRPVPWAWLSPRHHGVASEGNVRESSLKNADGFGRAVPVFAKTLNKGYRVAVRTCLPDRDSVQAGVDLPVAGAS